MATYTTADIRNLALVGGAGSGKTTLVEALLKEAGVIGRAGRVEDGNTVCDFEDLEKEFGSSLDSAVVHFDHDGSHVNMIDTPGLADFSGMAISVFPAVETVCVVISAHDGIAPMTRRMMNIAKQRNLPRMIIINYIDDESADLEALTEPTSRAWTDESVTSTKNSAT